MSMESCRDEIVAKLVAAVQGFFADAKEWPEGHRLYVAEYRAFRLAQEIARGLLQGWLDSLHGGHCGPRHVDGQGVERDFKQYVKKGVRSLVGAVVVNAAQYHKAGETPSSVYPLREKLGVGPGAYSRGMEEVIALAGVQEVFRDGLVLVNRLTGANVSQGKAAVTTAAWGVEAKARTLAAEERAETPAERIAATLPIPGLRRCVTTDGVMVQTTEGWREVKLMAAYEFGADGHKVGQAAYGGTLHYEADYSRMLWRLMEETRASRAEILIWLGDGAAWIWTQATLLAPQAVLIVDFYHASDHLWTIGRALHAGAGGEAAAKRWVHKWIRNLYNGKVQALLRELAAQGTRLGEPPPGCPNDDPRKVLADAVSYFTHNAPRMHYAEYRAKGYPIGSGVAESSCRHLVGLRMRRTATMTWRERNAEAMVQLRCVRASGTWDRFWDVDKLWEFIRPKAA
jgi:hypothetical protein